MICSLEDKIYQNQHKYGVLSKLVHNTSTCNNFQNCPFLKSPSIWYVRLPSPRYYRLFSRLSFSNMLHKISYWLRFCQVSKQWIQAWVFWEGNKIWKKFSSYFWQERRVLCEQQPTCQKVDEEFLKQMWTSRIIRTLKIVFGKKVHSWIRFLLSL